MKQENVYPESAPDKDGSTQTEFLRRLPKTFDDLVASWHLARKRSCPLQELRELQEQTEKLVEHLRDKRVDRILNVVRRVNERLQFHVRQQQPLTRIEMNTLTSLMINLRQAGIEEIPAELRKRSRALARNGHQGTDDDPIEASASGMLNPLICLIDPDAQTASTLATRLEQYRFAVTPCTDALMAVEASAPRAPDAIVARLPADRPVTDACTLTGTLREHFPAHVPIFWIVNRAQWQTRLDLLRAGGDGCFEEPLAIAALASRLRAAIQVNHDGPPRRVLLVHADPETRNIRAAALREAGFSVESAGTGQEALAAGLRFPPETALVDASLPDMDGIELARLWREDEALRAIPMILLRTGGDLSQDRNRFRQLELDYLLHPFSESDLLERLYLRTSQYRGTTSTVPRHLHHPRRFLERWQFEEHLQGATLAEAYRGLSAILFLEVEGNGPLTRAADWIILGLLASRVESVLSAHLLPEDLSARYDDAAYAILVRREDANQLEGLQYALQETWDASMESDSRLSDFRMTLGMARIERDRDARVALQEAARLCRSNAQLPWTAPVVMKSQDEGPNTPLTAGLDESQRRQWSERISDAILGKKLFLVFQPIHTVHENDAVERYEVLLRIRETSGQVCLPAEILTMAERLGMGGLLDRWVIDTALGVLSAHQSTHPDTIFFLKVTGGSIQDERFPKWLTETMLRHGTAPNSVIVQFREADVFAHQQLVQEMIPHLRDQGIRMGLEHFGLKPQSLELLQSLDVDFVKLDRALVQDLAAASNRALPTLKLVDEARKHGVKMIASYVENADSLAQFLNQRVDLIQGNFLQGPDSQLVYDRVL